MTPKPFFRSLFKLLQKVFRMNAALPLALESELPPRL
jgi:hypothetical protein